MIINNTVFDPRADDFNYQDQQERHIAALRDFYLDRPNRRMRIVTIDELQAPLEKSRVYGPFSSDVLAWCMTIARQNPATVWNALIVGLDADGREYLEY